MDFSQTPLLKTIYDIYIKIESTSTWPYNNRIHDGNFRTEPAPGFTRVPLSKPFTYNPQTDDLFVDGVLVCLDFDSDRDDDDPNCLKIKSTFEVTYVGLYRTKDKRKYAHQCLPARIKAAMTALEGYRKSDLLEVMRESSVTYTLNSEMNQETKEPQVYRVGTWTDVKNRGDDVNMVFTHGYNSRNIASLPLRNFREVLAILELPDAVKFLDLPLSSQGVLVYHDYSFHFHDRLVLQFFVLYPDPVESIVFHYSVVFFQFFVFLEKTTVVRDVTIYFFFLNMPFCVWPSDMHFEVNERLGEQLDRTGPIEGIVSIISVLNNIDFAAALPGLHDCASSWFLSARVVSVVVYFLFKNSV